MSVASGARVIGWRTRAPPEHEYSQRAEQSTHAYVLFAAIASKSQAIARARTALGALGVQTPAADLTTVPRVCST